MESHDETNFPHDILLTDKIFQSFETFANTHQLI